MAFQQIIIKTKIAADAQKVWECWNGPSHITHWCYASPDWHCPSADNDLRVGGKLRATMASKDGQMSFEFGGVYDEIIDGQKISFMMEDGRRVTALFEANGGQTEVTETFDAETSNPLDMQKAGWQAILDNFKHYVENN